MLLCHQDSPQAHGYFLESVLKKSKDPSERGIVPEEMRNGKIKEQAERESQPLQERSWEVRCICKIVFGCILKLDFLF